jgi:hypothetical protein
MDGPGESLRRRLRTLARRLRRIERREARDARYWLEDTDNLTRLSVVVFVPLLVALVTLLSNAVRQLSFLLFPPLASGTYTLFAEPESRYASPRRFVGGLTVGALCGWVALAFAATALYDVPPTDLQVQAGAAALAVFLTAVVTWALSLELPTAFSTALLVLITGTSQFAYVVGVVLSSSLVAAVFVVYREEFYEERAQYLYRTTQADDHVLVPMRGPNASATATFGARIAAAHDAAKVVLLDLVGEADVAEAERAALDGEDAATEVDAAVTEAARRLEAEARRIETKVGVPCEVLVSADGTDPAGTTLRAAREANCDLVVAPLNGTDEVDSPFARNLFRGDVDVVAFRPRREQTEWRRVLVTVRESSDVAHAMLDYAARLAGPTGSVAICTCIDRERQRRRAERTLANLAETLDAPCETRVSRASVEGFLERNGGQYDAVLLGASTDRSAASRFVSRPTYERLGSLDTDVAVVHTP